MSNNTKLRVYGPFEIPYTHTKETRKTKRIEKEHCKEFWQILEKREESKRLDSKHGCYIFAIRTAKGAVLPFYVGRTKGKNGFVGEIFTDHKVRKYNELLFDKVGTPLMYFVAPDGNKKTVEKSDLAEMERYLIQHGKMRNSNLLNKVNAKLPTWSIVGVVRNNTLGHPGKTVQGFRKMMGI